MTVLPDSAVRLRQSHARPPPPLHASPRQRAQILPRPPAGFASRYHDHRRRKHALSQAAAAMTRPRDTVGNCHGPAADTAADLRPGVTMAVGMPVPSPARSI
eukprot:3941537-Rhodomonas_salina.8